MMVLLRSLTSRSQYPSSALGIRVSVILSPDGEGSSTLIPGPRLERSSSSNVSLSPRLFSTDGWRTSDSDPDSVSLVPGLQNLSMRYPILYLDI